MRTAREWDAIIDRVDRIHPRHFIPAVESIQKDAIADLVGLNAAFAALKKTPYGFDIYTCDAGYGVKLFTAPEHGSDKVCEEFGDDLASTIQTALAKAAHYTKTIGGPS